MVSSAMYRYFPSRDELLTRLIIDAYGAVADEAEAADASRRRGDHAGRWLAVSRAIRRWAAGHLQEYGLIYGSPVPGYRAPVDTIDPAARVSAVFLGLLSDASAAGEIAARAPGERAAPMPASVRADLARLRELGSVDVDDEVLARAVGVWTQMFGTISFELFGHLNNVVEDYDGFFDVQMRAAWRTLTAT
jgi:AcrR family transcriptional regulator